MKWRVTAYPDGTLVDHSNDEYDTSNKNNKDNNNNKDTKYHTDKRRIGTNNWSKQERKVLLDQIKHNTKGRETRTLPFVVWEANYKHYKLNPNNVFYIVQKKRYPEFLEKMLINEKGLSCDEAFDFLEYWKEELENKTDDMIFQFVEDAYLADFKLVVEPSPSSHICVFVLFKSLTIYEKKMLEGLETNQTNRFWERHSGNGVEVVKR
eukprot:CAMPEP_0174253352 /NCGR_PEP_ID=MMETSP0439-20130205/2725_1 /TAXON_ID=0 /ORGANISM="Stereomyxa ramosa, Strain Chinc5" /LENGTH=207 /DNA_ID=CAMNT_0015334337 /DNA_START=1180 /DNA_END=1800 /DNA_ORIENTATION=-